MISIKSSAEIKLMRENGKIAAGVLERLLAEVRADVRTLDLDEMTEKLIREQKATPSFKGYRGYPASLCASVNEVVVHGIPQKNPLQEGDLLTLDLGVFYRGFHTDLARSVEVKDERREAGERKCSREQFLAVGRQALRLAIDECREGKRVGDISAAIQKTIEGVGYNVLRSFTGHGIGRALHEPPPIPCFGDKNSGEVLQVGMVLAIEVMYCQGSPEVETLSDGWTVITKDKSLSAMFEETVAVTRKGPLVLTKP